MKDPIVEEIHKHRKEHAKQFDNDPKKIFADILAGQEEMKKQGKEFVKLPPKLHKKEVA